MLDDTTPDRPTHDRPTHDRPTPAGPVGTGAPAPAVEATGLPGDAGMATAEYAIATLAACGFAGLLVAILTSGQVRGMLLAIVERALTLA